MKLLKFASVSPFFFTAIAYLVVQPNQVSAQSTDPPPDAGPYRMVTLEPPDGLKLEVSGMALLPDGRLAVAIRKGEIWIIHNPYDQPPTKLRMTRFAAALHEPLGLLYDDGALLTVQRSELTRIRDVDGDDVADEYLTVAKGWGVSGNYHEYAFGPVRDRHDDLWVALNISIGKGLPGYDRDRLWRGWAVTANRDGQGALTGGVTPMAAGLRSPSGIGTNAQGDVFCTDQQGNWFATCPLLHLRKGAFYGHGESLPWANRDDSPVQHPGKLPDNLPLPEAVKRIPGYTPPAVWFPYEKMGRGSTDILCDTTGGKFGPFENQLFVGDFTLSLISRVFLEKVDGQYQGACFPFLDGFQSAVFRLAWGKDGSLFVGQTNRGWNSLGTRSYGLQRVVWTGGPGGTGAAGATLFEIKAMRAKADGFELEFTEPVDRATASDPASYNMVSYTYRYRRGYGGPEYDRKSVAISRATVSEDGRRVMLRIDGLREYYVHELQIKGVRSAAGTAPRYDMAYYTLNHIPKK